MASSRHNAGFTLIELAIALMVIGLLIGGVLKGQELIQNARVTRTIVDLRDFQTAMMMFRNTYNALPGDMLRATTRLPNCTSPCGNGDGANGIRSYEALMMWIHFDRANLMSGISSSLVANETPENFALLPPTPLGGYYGMQYMSYSDGIHGVFFNSNILVLGTTNGYNTSDGEIPVRYIAQIDRKTDDGTMMTGNYLGVASTCPRTGWIYNESATGKCSAMIRQDF